MPQGMHQAMSNCDLIFNAQLWSTVGNLRAH